RARHIKPACSGVWSARRCVFEINSGDSSVSLQRLGNMRHPELGSVITFDPSKYPFPALFLDRVRSALPSTRCLGDLASLHELVGLDESDAVYNALYSLVQESNFRELYSNLIEQHVARHFDSSFRFQRVPGIRIHTPNSRTVQFHSDYWYGHGPEVLNFW